MASCCVWYGPTTLHRRQKWRMSPTSLARPCVTGQDSGRHSPANSLALSPSACSDARSSVSYPPGRSHWFAVLLLSLGAAIVGRLSMRWICVALTSAALGWPPQRFWTFTSTLDLPSDAALLQFSGSLRSAGSVSVSATDRGCVPGRRGSAAWSAYRSPCCCRSWCCWARGLRRQRRHSRGIGCGVRCPAPAGTRRFRAHRSRRSGRRGHPRRRTTSR